MLCHQTPGSSSLGANSVCDRDGGMHHLNKAFNKFLNADYLGRRLATTYVYSHSLRLEDHATEFSQMTYFPDF